MQVHAKVSAHTHTPCNYCEDDSEDDLADSPQLCISESLQRPFQCLAVKHLEQRFNMSAHPVMYVRVYLEPRCDVRQGDIEIKL